MPEHLVQEKHILKDGIELCTETQENNMARRLSNWRIYEDSTTQKKRKRGEADNTCGNSDEHCSLIERHYQKGSASSKVAAFAERKLHLGLLRLFLKVYPLKGKLLTLKTAGLSIDSTKPRVISARPLVATVLTPRLTRHGFVV